MPNQTLLSGQFWSSTSNGSRWLLTVIWSFLYASTTLAQSITVGGGQLSDSAGRQTTPCISPEQRAAIQQRLQLSRQKLDLQPSQTKLPHPLLIHPLRKAAHCPDFYPSSIWQLVDHNPTVGTGSFNTNEASNRDYNCGIRTYDNVNGYNHSGTDFGLWPFGWFKMDQNMVEVVAAAPGVILEKDDGNPDRSCNGSVQSTNWNAVYIQHADGSVAWYGHLKRGSLTFKPVGSTVEAGEYLGSVGSSGFSTDPHLHFELYSSNNQLIDPYAGSCNVLNGTDSWWLQQEPYVKKQVNALTIHRSLLSIGNNCPAENVEKPNELRSVAADEASFYIYVWGRDMERNDRITTALYRPNGSLYSSVSYISNFASPTFYTYYLQSIPATESLGPWQAQITFGGQTYTKNFLVTGPGADLSLTMNTSALTVPLNATVGYNLTLKNEGTLTANNIQTRAYLPVSMTFVDSPDGSMTHAAGVVSGNTITLGVGSSRTLRFRARPIAPGTFLTTAQIVQSSVQDPDSQPNSGTRDGQDDMSVALIRTNTTESTRLFVAHAPGSTTATTVEDNQPVIDPRRADLSLSLLTNKRVLRLTDTVDVAIQIKHQGGTKAENIVVQCTLPTGLSYAGGLSATGTVITGTVGGLYAGQNATLTFRAVLTRAGRWPIAVQLTACNQTDPDSQANNGTTNGEDDTALVEVRSVN